MNRRPPKPRGRLRTVPIYRRNLKIQRSRVSSSAGLKRDSIAACGEVRRRIRQRRVDRMAEHLLGHVKAVENGVVGPDLVVAELEKFRALIGDSAAGAALDRGQPVEGGGAIAIN